MLRLPENQLATSPSFLQSVLAGSVEAELSDLHVELKELEKNIQLLTVGVHEDITGRYINFDKFTHSDGDYLQTAQKYIEDLENISFRIADGQVKTDVEQSAQELLNLQDALNNAKTTLSVIYQLLSIDCALLTVKKSIKPMTYLEAASCYAKIPPMFEELSQNSLYLDLFEGLKKECRVQCKQLCFQLKTLWTKNLSWNATEPSLGYKTKSVSLKILKAQEMDVIDILTAFYYVGALESTLSAFGSSLLQLVLAPILTAVTAVVVKENQEHTLLSVEISLSKDKPSLTMVAANLKIVFDFINEQMNINLGSSGSCLSILGAFISNDFSKMFLKECLITSSKNVQEQDFSQGLEELNELVDYISDTGFLHCDNITRNVTKLMKSSVSNLAFWECATYLEEARVIMKKDLNETIFLDESSACRLIDGHAEEDVIMSMKQGPYQYPACRVSTWILELMNLFQELLKPSSEEYFEQCHQFFESARRIIEMYAAIGSVRCRTVGDTRLLECALFYNNSMCLAHRLSQLGFDNEIEKYSKGQKLIAVDLVQRIRAIAVESILQCLKKQRNSIVQKTKGIDVMELKNSCAELEKTVKACLLQIETLRSAWRGVLPNDVYMKAMGGIVNAWLEELMKVLNCADSIPVNIVRDIKVVYKVVADCIRSLMEVPNEIGSHVPRWVKFEAVISTRFAME